MATLPPQAAAPASQPDPTQDPAAAQPDAAQDAGYEICIKVAGDGSLSVGVESPQAEAAEVGAMGGADDDSSYKPAANIKEALTMALEIFKADGQVAPEDDGEDQFAQGFKSRGY